MSEISVCIPSRGPALGLWATIASCEDAGLTDIHVALVRDDEEPHRVMAGYGINIYHATGSLGPDNTPRARNLAASHATGKYILFLDDHCIIPLSLPASIIAMDVPVWHCAYKPSVGNCMTYYHFFGIESAVQGDYSKQPVHDKPYRCASAPSGIMAVRRDVWEALGGYWDSYVGFGGEEASFDLYAWSKGYEVWIDPSIVVHHFSARADQRGYDKTINPDNYKMALERLGPELPRLREMFQREGIPYYK